MIAEWRLFLLALRYFTRLPVPTRMLRASLPFDAAARYLPLVGVVIGAVGALIFWLAAQVWPESLAVLLSMLGVVLLTGAMHEQGLAASCALFGTEPGRQTGLGALGLLFVQLIRYDALVGLSSARLAFALPAHVGLGLTMIAGHAASRALVVSAIGHPAQPPTAGISTGALAFALLCGFLPATLLGTPGMFGLAAAILVRLAFVQAAGARPGTQPGDLLGATQQLTEVAFYLGTLATWSWS